MNRRLRLVSTRATVVALIVGSTIVATGSAGSAPPGGGGCGPAGRTGGGRARGDWRQSAPPVAPLSAGYDSTCAVTTAGGVRCWGTNDNGQLGNGTTTASQSPVAVSRLTSGIAPVTGGA